MFHNQTPKIAIILGFAGALPFGFGALLKIAPQTRDNHTCSMVLKTYSASILSFMGAVHWGLEMAQFGGTLVYYFQAAVHHYGFVEA
jgi:hypothetical protein